MKYVYITTIKEWSCNSGWNCGDCIDSVEYSPDEMRLFDNPFTDNGIATDSSLWQWIIAGKDAKQREHDGDEVEHCYTVSLYQCDDDCVWPTMDGKLIAEASRWEHGLWEEFRPEEEGE